MTTAAQFAKDARRLHAALEHLEGPVEAVLVSKNDLRQFGFGYVREMSENRTSRCCASSQSARRSAAKPDRSVTLGDA